MIIRTLAMSVIDAFRRAVGIGAHEDPPGLPDIDADSQVDIDGVGDRFSGSDEVDPVSHQMEDDGYETNIDARRDDLTDK